MGAYISYCIFIYSCGSTHLMNIITVWNPLYWLDGFIKVITAVSSIGTAFALIKITPQALTIPTAKEWLEVNRELKSQEKQLQEKNMAIQQSEQALRESEERYNTLRDIFDSVVIHQNHGIVYANPAAATLLGAGDVKTLIGKSVMDFVHPEYSEVIKEREQALEEGQRPPLMEQKITRLDGTEIDIESISVPFTYMDKPATQMIIRDISERKEQERILRESEAKFRGLFESDMIGTMFWEINGKITDANNALLQMIGYSRTDLQEGQIDWVQMTPAEFKYLDQEAHRQIMSTGIHAPYEKAYVRKDGTVVPIQVGGAFIKGYTDRGVSYVIDITDRKKQEKELRESEAKFRHLFELDMLGIIFSDPNNNITDANDAFLKMVGYSRGELNAGILHWQQLTPPGYEQQDQQAIQSLITTGSVSPYEKEYIRKDGTKVPILIGAALLKDTHSVIAFVLDITEQDKVRKELNQRARELQVLNAELEENQEVLRLSESRFRRMFESDLIGIVFWDKDGNFLEVNNLFLQTIGYTREEWERGDINWIALTPPEYAALDQQKLEEMDEKGMFTIFEKEYFRKDGTRVPILLGGARLEGFSDRGVSYILDITHLKKVQKELEERARELARSNEELEQFAYIASHDLQEPLRTMAGFANLLEKKYKNRLDQDANEFIEFIVDAADRMKKLITNLLEYSRINTKESPFEAVDFNKVLSKVIYGLQGKIQSGDVEIKSQTLPMLQSNEGQMQQVFAHLLGNAVKFRDERPLQIEIWAEERETHWLFAVKDTGIGINMAYATRIFQVFQRLHTRDKYEGTGIGLSVCKKIVEKHGGEIWVESVPDVGSTFYFTIRK